MNQKKLRIAVFLVLLAVFNAIFYLSGVTERGIGAWIAYAVVHIFCFLVLLIGLSNHKTSENLELQKAERIYVKKCSADLKGIMDKVNNRETYKQIEKVYDFIHASPIKSNEQVMEYEIEVFRLIRDLDKYVEAQNIEAIQKTVDNIMKYASQRNHMLSAG